MNKQAYGHLFTLFGGVNALYAISMWAITQGGFGLSDLPGLDSKSRITSSFFVIVFIGTLLTLTTVVGTNYILKVRKESADKEAATSPATDLEPLLPKVALGEQGTYQRRTFSGFVYQTGILLLFIFLPLGSIVHLNQVVADRGIVWNEELPSGAALKAACMLPEWWPFGYCADDPTVVRVAYESRDIEDTGPPKFDAGKNTSRLWLTNHWCDVYWAREMAGPQVEKRNNCSTPSDGGLSSSEARSRQTLSLFSAADQKAITTFADSHRGLPAACDAAYAKNACTGFTNRSENCHDDGSGCRGVQWVRGVTPALIILPSLVGVFSVAEFLMALWLGVTLTGLIVSLAKILALAIRATVAMICVHIQKSMG